jgi:hypothetical protein
MAQWKGYGRKLQRRDFIPNVKRALYQWRNKQTICICWHNSYEDQQPYTISHFETLETQILRVALNGEGATPLADKKSVLKDFPK